MRMMLSYNRIEFSYNLYLFVAYSSIGFLIYIYLKNEFVLFLGSRKTAWAGEKETTGMGESTQKEEYILDMGYKMYTIW